MFKEVFLTIKIISTMRLNSLDFGELNGNEYSNNLLDWSIQIPDEYRVSLKTALERDKDFKMYDTGRLMDSEEAINERKRWTELLEINDQEVGLHCEIRRVWQEEIIDLNDLIEKQIKAFTEAEFLSQDFSFKRGNEIIKGDKFQTVEFTEVKYLKGNSFSYPFIWLIGLKKDILIKLVLSSYDKIKRDELLKKFTQIK